MNNLSISAFFGPSPSPLLQQSLQDIRMRVSKVYHISSSKLHQLVWYTENTILFVSGIFIVHYDILTGHFKIIERNQIQSEILIFKCLKREFSNIVVGYITKLKNNRYQFLYKNSIGNWKVISNFTLKQNENILDCNMINQRCVWLLLKTLRGKKLLILRNSEEIQYERQDDDIVHVFSLNKDQLILVNRMSVEKINIDPFLLVVNIVKTVQTKELIIKGDSINQHKLIFTTNKIIVVKDNIDTYEIQISDHDISIISDVQVTHQHLFLTEGEKITRFTLHYQFDIQMYCLINPISLTLQNLQTYFVSPEGKQILIKTKSSKNLQTYNVESYALQHQNYLSSSFVLKLQLQSKFAINSIQHIPTRFYQILYLKDSHLHQNSIKVSTEPVICFSVSTNGLYLLAGFQYYLKGYYLGKNRLFHVQSLPLLNIIDVKFCYGDRYAVLTKQELKIYRGIPSELVYSWSLPSTNKYLSMQINTIKWQIIVYQQSGNTSIYCLMTLTKLRQFRLQKSRPILFDFKNETFFGMSGQINIHSLESELNLNLQYKDCCIPTHAVLIQNGGFIAIGTNIGSIRFHKWPPIKQFIENYREINIFVSAISSMGFDQKNYIIYVGSQSGEMFSIKIDYEAYELPCIKGMFFGLYIQSRRKELQYKIQTRELETKLQNNNQRYHQQIMQVRNSQNQSSQFANYEEQRKALYLNKIKCQQSVRKIREQRETKARLHQKNMQMLKDKFSEEISNLRKIGNQYQISAKQILLKNQKDCKDQEDLHMINQVIQNQKRSVYKQKNKIQDFLSPTLISRQKIVSVLEVIEEDVKLQDQKMFERQKYQQLKQLQVQFDRQEKRNKQLRYKSSTFPDMIKNMQNKIINVKQLHAIVTKQLADMKEKPRVDIEQFQLKIKENNEKVDQMSKKDHSNDVRKQERDVNQVMSKVKTLQSYNSFLEEQDLIQLNQKYFQMLDRLQKESKRALAFDLQIKQKTLIRQKLKEFLQTKKKKTLDTCYKLENCQTEIVRTQKSLNNENIWRKRSINKDTKKHKTSSKTEFVNGECQFQLKMIQMARKTANSIIQIRNHQNENLLVEEYRLKKETVSSEFYLKFLKSRFSKAEIEKIQCKKHTARVPLKPTPFQSYRSKKRASHAYTSSLPLSRNGSLAKISTPLQL